jgi:hypothetical protein
MLWLLIFLSQKDLVRVKSLVQKIKSIMGALEKEIQALKMKQIGIEKKQKKDNGEVWSRIQLLEKLALENETGVDAGKVNPSVQIALNRVANRRGYK